MPEISILKSRTSTLCKRFYKGESGVKSKPARPPTYFTYSSRSIDGIRELSALISELEKDRSQMIVRGQLADDVDANKPVRRKLWQQDRSDPNEHPFVDVPVQWIMIDVDKLTLPDDINLLRQPVEAIQYAINQLPEEFHNVSCYWQLSGSAGVFDSHVISAHLFYWLTEPVANELLRKWAKALSSQRSKRLVDYAVFNAVQPHYIASPIFEDGVEDPFPDVRSGFIEGRSDIVDLQLKAPQNRRTTSVSRAEFDEDNVRGFNNIIATMGDAEGQNGFYEPLLRSTASFVSAKGGDEAERQREDLKEYLRRRVDEADQSSHSHGEIERYRSDKFLDDLIDGAIEKFGDRKALPPYFGTESVSIEEGERELEGVIDNFASRVRSYYDSEDSELHFDVPTLAIKATAGLGKTSRIIKRLISASALKQGDVHYFVPNHRLSRELVGDLEEELDFDLPAPVAAELDPLAQAQRLERELTGGGDERAESGTEPQPQSATYSRVRLISGRGQRGEDGQPLCLKSDLAQLVAKSGQKVSSTLCKSKTETCEYYFQCGYQQQFEEEGIEVPEDSPLSELLWEVAVLTHSHMFLNTKDRLHNPKLFVVDESFYQSGIAREEVTPTELYRNQKPISRLVHDTLLDGETGLLAALRGEGYVALDVRKEAAEIESEQAEAAKQVTPSQNESRQRRILTNAEPERKSATLLRQLAAELEVTDRDVSHSVYFDPQLDKIVVTYRKLLTIQHYIPTVFIDADLRPEILGLFRDGAEVKEIAVERRATVHQFTDLTFSKTALLSNGEKSEVLRSQVKAFTRSIGKTGKTLLVCSKAVRVAMTGEQGSRLAQDYSWEGVTVTHFGSLRGVNKYEDYQNIIILGREQPSAEACENQARALWWNSEDPLTLLESKAGQKPLESEYRGYRIRDGRRQSVAVKVHPDHRVQLLLEQIRECETTQAVDRLRLLRDHPEGLKRQVFILSSVPVDITVDHLWRWETVQKLLALWDEADGVLPLNAKHMVKRCPESAGSERTARRLASEFKTAMCLIYSLIREVAVYTVPYRAQGQKRPSEVLVAGDVVSDDLVQTLSELAGGTVNVDLEGLVKLSTSAGCIETK